MFYGKNIIFDLITRFQTENFQCWARCSFPTVHDGSICLRTHVADILRICLKIHELQTNSFSTILCVF